MKVKMKRIILIGLLISMVISCFSLIHAENDTISAEEAFTLAVLHYYGNATGETDTAADDYVMTPLYDQDDTIVYYCFDFLEDEKGKGYAVIAANIDYLLCPELSYDGFSRYYQNALEGEVNIYYSPLAHFTKKATAKNKNTAYYCNEIEISAKNIQGKIYKGFKKDNLQLINKTEQSIQTLGTGIVVYEDPYYYLQNNGFTNVGCSTFGSIESGMGNSKHAMYDSYNSTIDSGINFSNGLFLKNKNHCAITAMANIMMYWRSICCPNYPANYDDMFAAVCKAAVDKMYFYAAADISSGFSGKVSEVFLEANSRFSYNGTVKIQNKATWDFLTLYIKDYNWPIFMGFSNEAMFEYSQHAVVAFGYTVMNCRKGNIDFTFKYVKVNDGWAMSQGSSIAETVYINWNMIEDYEYDDFTSMYAFCPYQV